MSQSMRISNHVGRTYGILTFSHLSYQSSHPHLYQNPLYSATQGVGDLPCINLLYKSELLLDLNAIVIIPMADVRKLSESPGLPIAGC